MTTLEEMACDVFTDLYVFYSQEDGKTHTAGVDFDYRLSDYEMAQLNDLAIEIWSRRICTDDFYEFVNDGPWRLEDE